MIFIGERINGMFRDVKAAIADGNKEAIQDLARRQTEAGAKFLDVNVGTAAADQEAAMKWLVESIQEVCDTPLALDSQKLNVIQAGIDAVRRGSHFLINSCPLNTKADDAVLDKYLALLQEHDCSLIVLTMDKEGVPQNVDKRVEIAASIMEKTLVAGVPTDRIYIDPIVLPLNCSQDQPRFILEVVGQIKYMSDPPPHMTVGLSNVSQMAPQRGLKALINRTFLVMCIAAGMDSAICDVLDAGLVDAALTAEMCMNRQIYSDSWLKAGRA